MKKLLSLCMICLLTVSAQTQNTGIGTTTPQATLDVKGNQRFGGANKFITYDSVSGKIEWRNSNLYIPTSQYLFQHSAAADGLYYNNNAPVSGQLEYRNASGNPVFYTNFINGNGYFSNNLGIGTTSPLTKLHVFGGASGNPTPQGPLVVESNSNTYINVLSPNANETAVLFGNASNAANGAIVYNNASTPNGFQFRNNGNITRMVIDNTGNVGIGAVSPYSPLTFNDNLGEKISLYGTAGNNYGFGIQSGLLQIHTDVAAADIAFGHGSSNSFTERMRIINNVGYDGMILNGRLLLKNGSADLVGGGVWLYKADNTALLGLMGTQNNQNIGFYGGPAGWGFVYDAINSRVGIGISNPSQKLHVEGTTFLNGNVGIGIINPLSPLHVNGVSYFSPGGSNIQILDGNRIQAYINGGLNLTTYSDDPIKFTTFTNGGSGSERMRILSNGNVGIGTTSPTSKLHIEENIDNFIGITIKNTNTGSSSAEFLRFDNENGSVAGLQVYDITSSVYPAAMTLFNNRPSGNIRFSTGGLERMTIANNGNVGIGTTTPGFLLEINGTAGKPGGGSWSVASDARMKENVLPYTDGLSTLLKISPVKYHYNQLSGYDTKPEYIGVLAQEIKSIAPYMVGSFQKKGESYYNVDNSAMTYMLINAVKEQQQQIDELKKLVEKLLKQ